MKNIESAKLSLVGAICGGIIGSADERYHTKRYNFQLFSKYSRFTDDTVCSVAIADALANDKSFQEALQHCGMAYHHSGFGSMFKHWFYSENVEQTYTLSSTIYRNLLSVGYDYNNETMDAECKRQLELDAMQQLHLDLGSMRKFFFQNTTKLTYVSSVDFFSENEDNSFKNKISIYGAGEELKFG